MPRLNPIYWRSYESLRSSAMRGEPPSTLVGHTAHPDRTLTAHNYNHCRNKVFKAWTSLMLRRRSCATQLSLHSHCRNYHIFYRLIAGCTDEMRAELCLKGMRSEDFIYLKGGVCFIHCSRASVRRPLWGRVWMPHVFLTGEGTGAGYAH